MLKDITLGQYFPGNSVIHCLDPRFKILFVMVYIVLIFLANNVWCYAAVTGFIFSCVFASRVPVHHLFRGLKSLLFLIGFTAFFNLFMTEGEPLFRIGPLSATYEGLWMMLSMIARIVLLIVGTTLLTFTTSPISLTDGVEALLRPFRHIGVPAHELAMMMTIALRFIPTLLEETDKIMKAQSARGADFDGGNLLRRIKSFIPLLIPLFVSAFRRADELATAMECRCYQGGECRTRLRQLEISVSDIVGSVLVGLFSLLVILLRMVA